MEFLPSSNTLLPPPGSLDSGLFPRLETAQLRRSSNSRVNQRGSCYTRVSLPKEDRNWFDVNAAISDYELFTVKRLVPSTFPTLSPITASPMSSPKPNSYDDSYAAGDRPYSPTGTHYATALKSPPLEPVGVPVWTLIPDYKGLLDESHAPSSHLGTSVSFPLLTQFRVPRSTMIETPQARESTQYMIEKHRSFSDSSLVLRQVKEPKALIPHSGGIPGASPHYGAKFHIPRADEDEDELAAHDNGHMNDGLLHENSCTSKKAEYNIRRFHALKELLNTEFRYLSDLRALVTVYLYNLSTLTYPASLVVQSPSLQATRVRFNSYSSHLWRQASNGVFSDAAAPAKDHLEVVEPYLFTKDEIGAISRNAAVMLQFHEGFLQRLETVVKPFGITVGPEQDTVCPNIIPADLDVATQAVAEVFLKEVSVVSALLYSFFMPTKAPVFLIYQDFCASHLEALEIIRGKQHHHPLLWDAFERHCALVISPKVGRGGVMSEPSSSRASPVEELVRTLSVKKRKRTASLTALDGAFRSLRAFASREYVSPQLDVCNDRYARLSFVDYLIKPVQRICKYPLLLSQLQRKESLQELSPDSDVIVEKSVKAMKDAVAAVDEAHHQKDIATRSSLIASRILLSTASGYSHNLSDVFLSSLGTCLLAGSLDMIHYSSAKSKNAMKAKYLGAFLYPGGYLILVRVNGEIYEPKHWFCLANFDLRDINEDIEILPSSFCLYSKDHLFELAAACPKEKDIWLSTIRESLAQPPTWTHEPISSLGGRDNLSWDDVESNFLTNQIVDCSCLPNQGSSKIVSVSSLKSDRFFASTSRTSSSATLKAIFTQNVDASTISVRRSSSTARQMTNERLQDVLSRSCLDIRAYAHSQEELFQTPKATTTFVRSNSSVSMSSLTRKRLSRHETVRIPRRNSLPNGTNTVARREVIETRSIILHEGSRKSIRTANNTLRCEKGDTSSHPNIQNQRSSNGVAADFMGNTARSLVHNMKCFFKSRSTSDVECSAASHHPTLEQKQPLDQYMTSGKTSRRWSMKRPSRLGIASVKRDAKGATDALPPRFTKTLHVSLPSAFPLTAEV